MDTANAGPASTGSTSLLVHAARWVAEGADLGSETAELLRGFAQSGATKLRVFEQLLASDAVLKIQQIRTALDHADQTLLEPAFLEGLRDSPATLVKVVQLLEDRLQRNIDRVAQVQSTDPGVVELLGRLALEKDSSEELRQIEAIPPQTREKIRKLFCKLQHAAVRQNDAATVGRNGTAT